MDLPDTPPLLVRPDARIAELPGHGGPSLDEVDRRRLHLWGLTLLLLAACAGAFVAVGTLGGALLPGWLGPETLRGSLVLLVGLFILYAIDAELRLRRLARRLVEERVLTTALTQRLAEMTSLLEAGRSVHLGLRIDEVLQAVLRSARELLDARDSSVMLVHNEDELRTVGVCGDSCAGGARVRFGEGIAGRVAATREALLIEGLIPNLAKQPHAAPPASAMSVPLIANDRLLGVMNVNAKPDRRYCEHDLRSFRVFADHAAAALANAQIYEDQRLRASSERFEAFHDALTGLPNRTLLLDRLGHSLTRRRVGSETVALLLVDLDNFRRINESLGHHAGDELLAAFSERIRRVVRAGDSLGRLGSDEFGLIAEPVRDTDEALATAYRILAHLAEPMRLTGRDLRVSASVGLAIGHSGSASDLLRQATVALRAAKAAGPGRVVAFETGLGGPDTKQLDLEGELEAALQQGAITVHYQPIVRIADRKIVAAEALARWNHPRRGLLDAGAFVPLAEQLGLLPAVDRIVVAESLALTAQLTRDLGVSLRMAANCAPSRLREAGLVDELRRALDLSGVPAGRFVLEITESSALRDIHAAATRLEGLRALGVSLSLDDFGTGYSSLSHLQRFPVDGVKIDRSFVADIGQPGPGRDLVDGVLRLAKALDLEVVAEGIENDVQLDHLAQLGCQLAQGYHVGRPMAAAAFTELLASCGVS